MNEIQKLHDVLLDNNDASLDELTLALENEISSFRPFRHGEKHPQDAFGIDLTNKAVPQLDLPTMSEQGEALENNFTKREIAFMFVSFYKQVQSMRSVASLLEGLSGLEK